MQNNSPAIAAFDALSDEEKDRRLFRTKVVATGALVACIVVLIVARAFQARYPALEYVVSVAEAAAIGGLADWYAVVALFRRPLGLPIPHTAIIPSNQNRIADNLGRFIEQNFLRDETVAAKLEEVDFARLVSDWLAEQKNAEDLAGFVTRMAPDALASLETSSIKAVIGRAIVQRLETVPIAPLAAELLSSVTAERRHQRLFDGLLGLVGGVVNDEATVAAMRDRIRAELPTLARVFRADAYLIRKILASTGHLIEEAGADPQHPLRQEFDRFVDRFVDDLKTDPAYIARAERIKANLLARPELAGLAAQVWDSLTRFVLDDVDRPNSVLRRQLASMFAELGRRIAQDDAIRADMNAGFVVALTHFVSEQKPGVATFIADQVKSWDVARTSRLVELNIGRDLQFIRFNGMIIGGLAGLVLHVGERLIFG